MNPYFHGRGIFRYDAALHAKTKIAPSDSTVGSRMAGGSLTGEATKGKFGGLAVFNRALTDAAKFWQNEDFAPCATAGVEGRTWHFGSSRRSLWTACSLLPLSTASLLAGVAQRFLQGSLPLS